MFYGLVHYPGIKHEGFQAFRKKYDPWSALLREHVTFIHPVPESIGRRALDVHIRKVLSSCQPFRVHFCTLEITWDHWMYLGAMEGHQSVVDLHDRLYEGILSPHLREDLPFYPHIGLGIFSNETYDFNDPTAKLTLDEEKYIAARQEFEALDFEVWCTVDRLTLVKIDAGFNEFSDLGEYEIGA
jgi:2'-5' RNA ligase